MSKNKIIPLLEKANKVKQSGNHASAIPLFHELYDLQNTTETAFNLAVLYKKTGKPDLAQVWAETAEEDLYAGRSVGGASVYRQSPKIDDFIAGLVDNPATVTGIAAEQEKFAKREMKLDRN